jgi:hypothetical protein
MTRGAFWTALLFIAAAAGVGFLQPELAREVHAVKQKTTVYAFPPPSQLRAMTLGYHAAAADGLWAKLLVEYGTHWTEKREFLDAPKYFDAILELEPSFPLVYRYAGTLIVYRPMHGTFDDVVTARSYYERGVAERPQDCRVWMDYGQFIAFLARSFTEDAALIERWRIEGAQAMAHSIELGCELSRSLSVANILDKAGERNAEIRHLRRLYALTDDQGKRDQIAARLDQLQASADRERVEKALSFIESSWRKDYPFLSRNGFLLLGPERDVARCAGLEATLRPADCPRGWDDALAGLSPSP